MKIYDISQEIFSCKVFPGDPAPERHTLNSIKGGDLYNLTSFSMCAHNGTHIDAPFHFINDGKTVDTISLEAFIGQSYVAAFSGTLSAHDAAEIIKKARSLSIEASKRILIKGDAVISLEAAKVFADAGILLIGNESQTVGPENAPMEVHKVLLGAGVVLLEGIRTADVPEGVYLLNAAPLNLSDADGSPCRAVLIAL
jgi:arylformamidase